MGDLARELIARRLKELDLTMVEVSRRLEMNDTYLQQFLSKTKASPRVLGERQRIMLAEILGVPEESLRGPSMPLTPRKYNVQNVASRKNNVVELSPVPYKGAPESRLLIDPILSGAVDLPIYGTSIIRDGDGEFILSESAVDWVARPPEVARVQDAYAVRVPRRVMEPAVKAGSLVVFHPHLTPRIGDICIYRALRDDGILYVKGGEYRGETDDAWKVHHYNPPRDFTLKKSEWQSCHRAVVIHLP